MEERSHFASIMGTAQQQSSKKSNCRYFCIGNGSDTDDCGEACEAYGIRAPKTDEPVSGKAMVKEHSDYEFREGARKYDRTHGDITGTGNDNEEGWRRET